ncbi:hypothetical protein GCM10009610_42850 [Pseudonocardia xinjiangensis]
MTMAVFTAFVVMIPIPFRFRASEADAGQSGLNFKPPPAARNAITAWFDLQTTLAVRSVHGR